MRKSSPSFFLSFLTVLSLFLILNTINAVEFTSFDYKNQYLEPSKTYDLWVVITPDEEINNTIIGIYPYGESKNYIQIIKGTDYEGQLFPSEKGVGHFIIKIKDGTPSKDYKIVAYCNYTKDNKQYSENRIFTIPVRGKPILTIENPPTIKEGINTIYLKITNDGTGTAQNIKMQFNNDDSNNYNGNSNIYSLSDGYIDYLKPHQTKLMEVKIYADSNGIVKLPYTLTYSNPYDELQLTDKTETKQDDGSTSTTYDYKNQKTIEEKGNLIFKVIPNDIVELKVNKYNYPVGEVNNFTLSIKNNYKDANFIITIGDYYLGNNQKTLFIKHGETKNISFKIKINDMGVKEIPVSVIFDGNEIDKNISINVIGKVQLVLTGIDIKGLDEKVITGDLSNIGTTKAKSVFVSIKKTGNIIPVRPYENYFVGTIDTNDYGSFELHCQINGNVSEIPIIIEYRDEDNNLIKMEKNISISVENEGLVANENNNGGNGGVINYIIIGIGVLFCIGVIYLMYRGFIKRRE